MNASQSTEGIKVSVSPSYQPAYSHPHRNRYVFSYQIRIENLSETTVQLLRRHWLIFDSSGNHQEVEGEGVIGQQPVLQPGQSHQYTSWCPLTTDIGRMHGEFLFLRLSDQSTFPAAIPEFQLIVPSRLN